MVDKSKLEKMHAEKFNCAQCVACAFCDRTGLDVATTAAATGGFGGGFRSGSICGAATGAVLVLGMCTPHIHPNAQEEKDRITKRTQEFLRRFKARFEYLDCRDLKGKGKVPCDALICGAAELLDQMLEEEG